MPLHSDQYAPPNQIVDENFALSWLEQPKVRAILRARQVAANHPGQIVVQREVVQQLVNGVPMVVHNLMLHHVHVQVRDQAPWRAALSPDGHGHGCKICVKVAFFF